MSAAILGILAVIVAIGLIVLWPGEGGTVRSADSPVVRESNVAKVTDIRTGPACEEFAGPGCRLIVIELQEGPNEGRQSTVTLPSDRFAPPVEVGDTIRVTRTAPGGIDPDLAERLPLDNPAEQPYAFVDFERRSPLLLLTILFAAFVIVLSRWQGLRSLIGLALSLLLVIEFVVPAILDGSSPLLVALVGALAVMFVTIVLSTGPGLKSAAAMLGSAAALALTVGLALLWVNLAHITGFSSEEATLLLGGRDGDAGVSLKGLVVAGMMIGALGVLDDVTVSQASTVLALRRANPAQKYTQLFRGALTVGRDHLSATVNTLVLAYAGAALPVLLIFANQDTSLVEAVGRESVAEEVVSMLVGSIGLICAVPLTTALAALLASRLPAEAIPATEAGHDHHH